jgi:hypothetical protein
MNFPTIDDCVALRGDRRALLHEFDYLLRDLLAATQHKARELKLADEGIEASCVVVMLSVAAGAAIVAAGSPEDVTQLNFATVARDALVAVKQKFHRNSHRMH